MLNEQKCLVVYWFCYYAHIKSCILIVVPLVSKCDCKYYVGFQLGSRDRNHTFGSLDVTLHKLQMNVMHLFRMFIGLSVSVAKYTRLFKI